MRIGITGHQRLEDELRWSWVDSVITSEIARYAPPVEGITSLAIGADQLFARLVLAAGGRLHAVLPYENIERSFSAGDVQAFRDLLSKATVEVLDTPGSDEDAYLAAGLRVAAMSNLLIAVWDGQAAKGKGGTADVVEYGRAKGIPLLIIDPVSQAVTRSS